MNKAELEDILGYFKEFVVDKYRFADEIKQIGTKERCNHIALQLTESTIKGLNYLIDIIEKKYTSV